MSHARPGPLLEVENLRVAYGKVEAVHDVSVRVERGSIVTVIGPNGAGKTTLLGALMGLLPSRGGLAYLGASAHPLTVEQRVSRGLILVPERRELFAAMSVADNLELGGFQRALNSERGWRNTQEEVYQRFPRLEERRDQQAGTLSGGEQQMLALGAALMTRPRLLMIDELSLGLAPTIVAQLLEVVKEIHSRGTTIVLVEQSVNVALAVADRAIYMERGQVKFSGPAAELLDHEELLHAVFLSGTGA